ncbi:hypothetical protein HW555_005501 [Spodoptera exigua]|uniref:Uncharacterized protein n=1 Tax=Spodoptera exigua TaxID=7107 RepID=A0A835GIC9_SPOEX|nr:hypothetical protein HW555_005501 [Spodoptera exigua]
MAISWMSSLCTFPPATMTRSNDVKSQFFSCFNRDSNNDGPTRALIGWKKDLPLLLQPQHPGFMLESRYLQHTTCATSTDEPQKIKHGQFQIAEWMVRVEKDDEKKEWIKSSTAMTTSTMHSSTITYFLNEGKISYSFRSERGKLTIYEFDKESAGCPRLQTGEDRVLALSFSLSRRGSIK